MGGFGYGVYPEEYIDILVCLRINMYSCLISHCHAPTYSSSYKYCSVVFFPGDVIGNVYMYQHASYNPLLMHSRKHHPLQPAPHMNKSTSPNSYQQRQNRKVKKKSCIIFCHTNVSTSVKIVLLFFH
ncbi:unnamed protein product [Owenia fusiformis]|uniref:Uncharacterized protein n=1 Tax=Owenia fusiformis TaxID=6347 RepID=A0A8J1XKH2_OWEFU|nr:unnamed protein product [Owenia fusiformis]